MRRSIRLPFLLLIVLTLQCESPFKTTPTIDGTILTLTAASSTERILHSALITISWPAIAIENFSRFQLARKDISLPDSLEPDWVLIATITDPATTTWQETIYDDASLRYRLTSFTDQGPGGSSEVNLILRPTTHLTIPTDVSSLVKAAASPVMDDDDTLFILPGHYIVSQLGADKRLHFIGMGGAVQTILDGGNNAQGSVLLMNRGGTLQGLTVQGGESDMGGGVKIDFTGLIRQCIIRENRSLLSQQAQGHGGGLYITGSTRVENCLILGNSAAGNGGGIYIRSSAKNVQIVNSVIFGNASERFQGGISAQKIPLHRPPSVTVINTVSRSNLGANMYPEYSDTVRARVIYSNTGEGWPTVDTTNVSGDPLFVDPANGNFHLQRGSIALDAGNPDPAYNDADSTRNDLGAYGGPGGDW